MPFETSSATGEMYQYPKAKVLGEKVTELSLPGKSGLLAVPTSALKSTVDCGSGLVVRAKACGSFPTFITVRLIVSDVVNLRVGPGEVKLSAVNPNPNCPFDISPSYNVMFTVGPLLELLVVDYPLDRRKYAFGMKYSCRKRQGNRFRTHVLPDQQQP